MSKLQIIHDQKGQAEYVLLPIAVYGALQESIEEELDALQATAETENDYIDFDPAEYVTNPVAIARLRAGIKQTALAAAMGVSQAYISKLEKAERVTPEALEKASLALAGLTHDPA